MSDNYYSIYLKQVSQLVETIVIKSEETARLMNLRIQYTPNGVVDPLIPTSWKYYMNLSGQYHSTDTMMTVVSLDTLEVINFTIDNLKIHRATARGYAYGTRQYKELVTLFPTQEMLILGILYPCDINAAIAAKDGEILMYPPTYVEEQERTLIAKVQTWIYGYKNRWINRQFFLTDNLYYPTMLGIMYLNLVPAILNFRLEVCKTTEAHSFHIRQYLASHGALDEYMDVMTLEQMLYFYRNIAYIERNSGSVDTFGTLIEHTMTKRQLPIAEYVMRHDLTNQPANLYPELMFKMNTLNIASTANLPHSIGLDEMLAKEDLIARDNAKYKSDEQPAIQQAMVNSRSNVVLTKALESAMIDYTNSTPYTLEDILFNHWLFLSSSGIYNTYIRVTNPTTGDTIPLTAKDAFTFMWYAFTASIGYPNVTVPDFMAFRVQRIPTPTVADLMSVVDPKYITVDQATQALSIQPHIDPIISTEMFYEKCKEIYISANMQRGLISYQEHHLRRGMMHGLVSRIYSDNVCRVETPGTTYAQWFAERNIVITDFNQNDLSTAYVETIKQATGLDLITTSSVKNLQRSMIRLMTQLSSYSVQFMSTINDSPLRVVDFPVIRGGDITGKGSTEFEVDIVVARGYNYRARSKEHLWSGLNWPTIWNDFRFYNKHKLQIDIPVKIMPNMWKDVRHIFVNVARARARYHTPIPYNNQDIMPIPGVQEYLQLNILDRQRFKDKAGNYWWPEIPTKIDLNKVIRVIDLNGLVWSNNGGIVDPTLDGFDWQ